MIRIGNGTCLQSDLHIVPTKANLQLRGEEKLTLVLFQVIVQSFLYIQLSDRQLRLVNLYFFLVQLYQQIQLELQLRALTLRGTLNLKTES